MSNIPKLSRFVWGNLRFVTIRMLCLDPIRTESRLANRLPACWIDRRGNVSCRFDGIRFTNRFPVSRIANTKDEFHFVSGSCFKCFCLGYVLFSTHFVFPIYLWKPKDFKTMVDWQSSLKHEFELSFHCRLDLQALEGTVGYVNQVVQSLHV